MPGPYRAAMGKRDVSAGRRAAYMRPLRMAGEFSATIVGGGVLDAPQASRPFRVIRRAANPLAAAEVCGSGKVCGKDESLPYGLNRERDAAVSCGPGMPGPYRAAMGKRDVSAGQRAAYMRPLQIGGRFRAAGVRGAWRRATSAASQQSWPARAVACPAGASIAHYPSFAPLNCGPSLATPQHPNLKWRKVRRR